MSVIELPIGNSRWTVEVPPERLVTVSPSIAPSPPITQPRLAVRDAMEKPLRFDHPLRRALTPDDRVALVIDEQLPRLGELVAGVLEYLAQAGIGPASVTILTTPRAAPSTWIDELPDEFADVQTEVHHPGDRKQLCYLSATKQGRRVYMNRTLVDADQIISLSGRRYEPLLGYAGCEASIYPAFSDDETYRVVGQPGSIEAPKPQADGIRAEAAEIVWLLGSVIFIQVIEGEGDDIAQIAAGLLPTTEDGVRLLDERWRFRIAEPADVVLATLGGDPARQDLASLAQVALAASRVVKPGGKIVLLSEVEAELSDGFELLRRMDEPMPALKRLLEKKPPDLPNAFAWMTAAEKGHLYLASGLKPELVEELFATPIVSPIEVQRLIDQGGSCLLLRDAQKCLVEIEDKGEPGA